MVDSTMALPIVDMGATTTSRSTTVAVDMGVDMQLVMHLVSADMSGINILATVTMDPVGL